MPRAKQIRIWIRPKKKGKIGRPATPGDRVWSTNRKRRGRKKKRVGGYFVFIWKRRLNIARAPHPSGRHSTPPRNKKTGRDFHFQNISFFFFSFAPLFILRFENDFNIRSKFIGHFFQRTGGRLAFWSRTAFGTRHGTTVVEWISQENTADPLKNWQLMIPIFIFGRNGFDLCHIQVWGPSSFEIERHNPHHTQR